MDGQNNPNQQTPQQVPPPLVISPSPAFRSHVLMMVLIGLVMLGIGIGGGYFLFTDKPNESMQVNNQQVIPASPTVTPTNVEVPTTEPTGAIKSYSNSTLGLSFQYTTPFQVVENINNSTALKADNEIWVSLPGSDQIILAVYYYKSNLSMTDWWSAEGIKKIQELQNDYYSVIQPKPSPFPPPNFSTKAGTVDGKQATIAEGLTYAAQRSGTQTITLVNHRGGIIMFVQQEADKKLSDHVLSSLKFY